MLFVVVTAFGCWLGWNLHRVGQRQRLIDFISTDVGMYPLEERPSVSLPWLCIVPDETYGALPVSWRLVGAKPLKKRILRHAVVLTADDVRRFEQLLPEVRILRPPIEQRQLRPHLTTS